MSTRRARVRRVLCTRGGCCPGRARAAARAMCARPAAAMRFAPCAATAAGTTPGSATSPVRKRRQTRGKKKRTGKVTVGADNKKRGKTHEDTDREPCRRHPNLNPTADPAQCTERTETPVYNLAASGVSYTNACRAEYTYNSASTAIVPTIYGPYSPAEAVERMLCAPGPVHALQRGSTKNNLCWLRFLCADCWTAVPYAVTQLPLCTGVAFTSVEAASVQGTGTDHHHDDDGDGHGSYYSRLTTSSEFATSLAGGRALSSALAISTECYGTHSETSAWGEGTPREPVLFPHDRSHERILRVFPLHHLPPPARPKTQTCRCDAQLRLPAPLPDVRRHLDDDVLFLGRRPRRHDRVRRGLCRDDSPRQRPQPVPTRTFFFERRSALRTKRRE